MTPEIEIRFEQLHLMKTELEQLFAPLLIDDKEIKSNPLMFVKASVKKEIQHVLSFLFSEHLQNKVSRIIVEIHYENSKASKNVAAYFNILKSQKSQNGECFFGIYFSVIKSKISQYLNSTEIQFIDQLWAHELIHLMDFGNLNTFHKQCQIEIENWRVKSSNDELIFNQIYNRDDTPKYLQILDLFSHFRNEGIAQLYPMLNGNAISFCNATFIDSKNLFKEQLNQIIQQLSQPFLSRHEYFALNDRVRNFRNLAYSIGHYMILSILTNSSNKKIKGLANLIINLFQRQQPININPLLIRELIYHAIKIDLGEYLYRLSFYQNTPEHGFYSLDDLLLICNLFTMNNFQNDYKIGFLEQVYTTAKAKDIAGFVNVLCEIIGGAMSQEEVLSEFESFKNNADRSFFLENEVFEKTNKVMMRYSLESDRLSLVTLTYILDSEDLIDDKIKYFGYLDDLFVLDTYFMLIN
jgi:uncharacterized membrane protein YkvA (DUF1232 family)